MITTTQENVEKFMSVHIKHARLIAAFCSYIKKSVSPEEVKELLLNCLF